MEGRVKTPTARQKSARWLGSEGERCKQVSRRVDLLAGSLRLVSVAHLGFQLSMISCLDTSHGDSGQTYTCLEIG